MIAETIRELPVTLADIKREALKDDFIHTTKNKIYNKALEVFSLCDDVLLYNDRVVIPSSLQKKNILRDFHMEYPGKNRTMLCYVYWQNMDKNIADMVDSCKGCALAAKAPAITCKPGPKTVQPWQRIHVDFTGPLDDQYYLIVVDNNTKWPEVLKCKRPTTNCLIGF